MGSSPIVSTTNVLVPALPERLTGRFGGSLAERRLAAPVVGVVGV